jgi:hypothetical protein
VLRVRECAIASGKFLAALQSALGN